MAAPHADRRGFLQAGAGAALASSLFTRGIRGANDRVSLAFIGTGRMGSANIGFAARVPGFEIVSVCDVFQPAREAAIERARKLGFGGVKPMRDFREILADRSIDAVCIATPDHWHAYMTIEACKAGKDVWVETPACVYVEEGVKMIAAARKYNRIVQAGTIRRSGGLFQKARDVVTSGALGAITFCKTWDYAGGSIMDRGVHLLDTVRFVFDEAMPLSVAAQGARFYGTGDTEIPGNMLAIYRYPGFVVSYQSHPNSGDTCGIAFHGASATLTVNRGGYSIFANRRGARPVVERGREMAAMNVPHWQNFLESIRSRCKPAGDIETCVRSTVTCLLADLALRHGMTLEWDDRAFTVKQPEAVPWLEARYRAPWKLEV